MKKWIALLCTALLCFTAFVGCREKENFDSGTQNGSALGNRIEYVTAFDCYEDALVCRLNNSKHRVNTDKAYISQGKGSMKVHSYGESYSMNVDAKCFHHDLTDLSEAKLIHLDVYNPNVVALNVELMVKSSNSTLLAYAITCEPGTWTAVQGIFDTALLNYIGEPAMSYVVLAQLIEPESDFEFYLDNFYIEFDPQAEKELSGKSFADKEISKFDTLSDLRYCIPYAGGRIKLGVSLNADPNFIKSGASLRLDVHALSGPDYTEIWNYTQYLYSGIKFNEDYVKQCNLTEDIQGISVWVYNTNISRKNIHLKVYDTMGYSAESSQWVYPDTWTQLQLTDFGNVNPKNINQIEVYLEGIHTFNDYSLYFDELLIM